ncbi:uncharacterized protein N7515_005358 [Penicillium bovifimosum]|uniref:Uncharacterized protein n=1 Tax=Penicillium bovifimosum TaxID=126998 RepID=A0A9W9KZS2_9EURO|nr:uncharacterized protein N7515_005358 [Penicillium bovifimosum]KAJ5129319.1 hypothetical protein N7515_005358 [Penicillium bovifimosum]
MPGLKFRPSSKPSFIVKFWAAIGISNQPELQRAVTEYVRKIYAPILNEYLTTGRPIDDMFKRNHAIRERLRRDLRNRLDELPEFVQDRHYKTHKKLTEILIDLVRFYRFQKDGWKRHMEVDDVAATSSAAGPAPIPAPAPAHAPASASAAAPTPAPALAPTHAMAPALAHLPAAASAPAPTYAPATTPITVPATVPAQACTASTTSTSPVPAPAPAPSSGHVPTIADLLMLYVDPDFSSTRAQIEDSPDYIEFGNVHKFQLGNAAEQATTPADEEIITPELNEDLQTFEAGLETFYVDYEEYEGEDVL